MKKNYTKIVLDLMLAITFVLLMEPRVLNGLPFHEIAGLVIGGAILVHIGLNFRWVINTTKKILDPKLPQKTRFSYLLNLLLLISMAAVIITGILISRVVLPSLAIQGGHSIRGIHGFSADATLALVGLHIAVHWKWVMSICKKALLVNDCSPLLGCICSCLKSVVLEEAVEENHYIPPANIASDRTTEAITPFLSFLSFDLKSPLGGP